MQFKDLAVSKKLIGAFALVLVVTAALGAFSAQRLYHLNSNSAAIADSWLPKIRMLGDMHYDAARARGYQATFLATNEEADRLSREKQMRALFSEITDMLSQYETGAISDEERPYVQRIKSAWENYAPMFDTEKDLFHSQGQQAAAAHFTGPMRTAFNQFDDAIKADITYNGDSAKAAGEDNRAVYISSLILIFLAIGLSVLTCVAAGIVLVRAVSRPLHEMTDAMGQLSHGNLDAHVPNADQSDEIGQLAEAMVAFKKQLAAADLAKAEQTKVIVSSIGTGLDQLAKGNLDHRITAELEGAFDKLKEDFNSAMARLQDTMRSVFASTAQIANGTGELSQATEDLSQRTEQQAASLEETAAALEEITTTVKRTAGNAREASNSVVTAKSAAEDGGRVVETAIKAMDEIAQSSRQITDIIGVIDEIAFQTNLLALNAGVEAARAGDAGRGFAVVASEVRALAQRSAEAAKQIKALIQSSSVQVDDGVRLVGETGRALKRIVDQVLQINGLVVEMAQAAEQQSTGIEQVNEAVNQMDQFTQQNAGMVEQSTSAARTLAEETQGLSDLIAFFSTARDGASSGPRPSKAAAPRRAASGSWAEF